MIFRAHSKHSESNAANAKTLRIEVVWNVCLFQELLELELVLKMIPPIHRDIVYNRIRELASSFESRLCLRSSLSFIPLFFSAVHRRVFHDN